MKNTSEPVVSAYPIESVGSVLRLLLEFRERPVLRVAQTARTLGVARSTAHRLLAMLVQYGFVVQNPRTRAYAPGPGLIAIGSSVSAGDDIQTALRPHLESLLATFGETIHICALRGAEVAFIGCIESQMALRAGNRTGTLLPAHATSSGKALLATLSDEEVKRLFPDDNLSARTRATIRTRTALLRELHVIRERKYATNSAESEHGLSAIACVVRSRTGEPRGAIAISGPQARMRKMDRTRMVAAMLRACAAARHSIR